MQSPRRANKTIFFLAIYMIVSNLLIGILIELIVPGANVIILTGIFQIVGLLVPFLFYLLVTKQSIKNVLEWKGLSLKNALFVIVISIAILPMIQIIFFLSSFIFVPVVVDFAAEVALVPFWLAILVVAVFPSVFEEIWFRGALFKEYRAGGVSIHKVAIITGIFFGLMHLNFNQAIYAASIGILYAYILYYTRSILAPMLAHFINNGLSSVSAMSESYMYWSYGLQENPFTFLLTMGIATLVMVPVAVFCMMQFKKHHANTEPKQETVMDYNNESASPKPKLLTWGFWAALAVFLLFTVIMEFALRIYGTL